MPGTNFAAISRAGHKRAWQASHHVEDIHRNRVSRNGEDRWKKLATLSSEEHRPNDLVRYAKRAEGTGFSFAFISDHYHPWVNKQGNSPFVWSVLGGLLK